MPKIEALLADEQDYLVVVGTLHFVGDDGLLKLLKDKGFDLAFPKRRASHEFIVTLKKLKDTTGVSAMDFAKRLLDAGHRRASRGPGARAGRPGPDAAGLGARLARRHGPHLLGGAP